MIGTSTRTKKRNPVLSFLIPILILLAMAGGCFAFCWILWWLNNATA